MEASNKVIQLIAIKGTLYFPYGGDKLFGDSPKWDCPDVPSMLIKVYAAGDCDTIPWPLVPGPYSSTTVEGLEQRLACALYDERETNAFFPDDAKIALPDGTVFDFEAVIANASASQGAQA
jgi:hypothetical protein